MVLAGSKAERLSSVNHATKTIHHNHHQKYKGELLLLALLKKALYLDVTRKFTFVKGQFKMEREKWKCEQKVMLSNLQDYKNTLKSLIKEYNTLLIYMINNYGKTFCNIITNCIMNRLRESQMVSLKTKNKKLRRLTELKQPLPQDDQVPIVNLTKYILSTVERSQFCTRS